MDKIDELLTRGVDKIYPSREELEKVLKSGKKLTLYQGFDPTGRRLHIGHMVGFRKLKQWQDLGHHVLFVIGDGTGQAGDPSGKTTSRDRFLTQDELRQNAKEYVSQASKIVRFDGENPIEIKYNGDWLNKLTLPEILEIIGHFSLQQLIERDLFQERMKRNVDINMREFFYPVLQGYDSVAMKVDLELGGNDQTFNMLCGRKLIKDYLKREKFVMTTPLLTDSSGRKIGKTEGNVIALNDAPEDLYGKIMALSDDVIVPGLEYLTDLPMDKIQEINQKLGHDYHPVQYKNPMQYKKLLAFEIVKQLNSEKDAEHAQEHFEKTVQNKELPQEIPSIQIPETLRSGATIVDALIELNLVESKSEAKRLIEQGGITVFNEVVTDPNTQFIPQENGLIKIGKRRIIRLKTAN